MILGEKTENMDKVIESIAKKEKKMSAALEQAIKEN